MSYLKTLNSMNYYLRLCGTYKLEIKTSAKNSFWMKKISYRNGYHSQFCLEYPSKDLIVNNFIQTANTINFTF